MTHHHSFLGMRLELLHKCPKNKAEYQSLTQIKSSTTYLPLFLSFLTIVMPLSTYRPSRCAICAFEVAEWLAPSFALFHSRRHFTKCSRVFRHNVQSVEYVGDHDEIVRRGPTLQGKGGSVSGKCGPIINSHFVNRWLPAGRT